MGDGEIGRWGDEMGEEGEMGMEDGGWEMEKWGIMVVIVDCDCDCD